MKPHRLMVAAFAFVVLFGLTQPGMGEAKRLVDNGDGTVTDLKTGLMWTKSVSSTKKTISAAKNAAASAAVGGHTDWRVSTSEELEGMAKIYPDYLDILDLQNGEYLTTTESRQMSGSIYVIGIHPKNKPYTGEGYTEAAKTRQYVVYYNGSKRYPFYYWLVRGPVR